VSEENGVKSQRGGSYGRMGVIMEEWDMEVEVEEWGQISRGVLPKCPSLGRQERGSDLNI
jgi:hypothetical protein